MATPHAAVAMIGLMDRHDPMLLAKSLLAQEFPMHVVAQQVGVPMQRLRVIAARENWIRRSRRDAYSPAMRVEALRMYEQTGSMTKTSTRLGVARQTIMRWLRAAEGPPIPRPVRWRCYTCLPEYGLAVEGSACSGCGEVRDFRTPCETDVPGCMSSQ